MTNLPTINIKGKEYVLVKDRISHFNEICPNGAIQTERISDWDKEIIKATVIPDCDKPARFFTGYSQAKRGDGYINQTSALENAETSAVGRALAFMGIGIIDSIASADEVNKAQNQNKSQTSASAQSNQSTDKPWFNEKEFHELEMKNLFVASFMTAQDLLDEIGKGYKISRIMTEKICTLWEKCLWDQEQVEPQDIAREVDDLPF